MVPTLNLQATCVKAMICYSISRLYLTRSFGLRCAKGPAGKAQSISRVIAAIPSVENLYTVHLRLEHFRTSGWGQQDRPEHLVTTSLFSCTYIHIYVRSYRDI